MKIHDALLTEQLARKPCYWMAKRFLRDTFLKVKGCPAESVFHLVRSGKLGHNCVGKQSDWVIGKAFQELLRLAVFIDVYSSGQSIPGHQVTRLQVACQVDGNIAQAGRNVNALE